MRRTLVLGIGLLLFVALGASAESVSPVRTELAMGASSQTLGHAHLPCEITIKAENRGGKAIDVDLNQSRVKTKRSLWQTLEVAGGEGVCASPTLSPSRRASSEEPCTLAQGCEQERRYKFKMTYDGNIVWAYYPSANGWTTDTVLDLGDVGRHFRGF